MNRERLLIVGYGMVGFRLLEELVARNSHHTFDITIVGEEPVPAYDRVHLTSIFQGASSEDLALSESTWAADNDITTMTGRRVTSLDAAAHTATLDDETVLCWDRLILATGSVPFVPPITNSDAKGVHVYRTLADVDAIRSSAATADRGVVIGGGLLGLEAADAVRSLGVVTTVVEFAGWPMATQLDLGGGTALRRRIEALGLDVLCSAGAESIDVGPTGRVAALRLRDGRALPADIVIVAAGVRPRDELARAAGLVVGDRGGVVIDDGCTTSHPDVFAIGEVACHRGRVYGLVGPGYEMAAVVADRLCGMTTSFTGADTSTQLKLLGVDVATAGTPLAAPDDAVNVVLDDPFTNTYRRIVLSADGTTVYGAVLVGHTAGFGELVRMVRGELAVPASPATLVSLPAETVGTTTADSTICSCNSVTRGTLLGAITEGCTTVKELKSCTRAGTTCGSCVPLLDRLLAESATAAGATVRNDLCEHFAVGRQELFDIVRATGIRSFAELIARHGQGRGCEVCKPTVASMFASLGAGYVLAGEQAGLQDTNDHALANMQRNGTYSVVPRVPAGEITPTQLITIGEVARDFDLYTKITGGQRIDLFGARIDQLPLIWRRLVDAGFESGHAYGKALRTVKSCVGTTWCRYGVQDSVGFAVAVENRYKGLRAPHKIKMAVSGCARECAEAQSKDVGFIATETGYDVYVCGNGGMRPRHATLLASNVSEADAIRYVDRLLMFYIRTADRLQRTSTWFEARFGGPDGGGITELRSIVIDDRLGIADELEAGIAEHLATYECEWTATINDPIAMERFTHFVNDPSPDHTLAFDRERGQRVPAPRRTKVADSLGHAGVPT